jgi:hypothetical protein
MVSTSCAYLPCVQEMAETNRIPRTSPAGRSIGPGGEESSGVQFSDVLMDADVLKGARGEERVRITKKEDVQLKRKKK